MSGETHARKNSEEYVNMNTLKWKAMKWYYMIIFYVVGFFTTYAQLTGLLFDILTPYRLRLPPFLAHKLIRVPWIFHLYRRHRTPTAVLSQKSIRWYRRRINSSTHNSEKQI